MPIHVSSMKPRWCRGESALTPSLVGQFLHPPPAPPLRYAAVMANPTEPARPSSALPEDAILVPTEGMTLEELDEVAVQTTAAFLPKINEWRVKNGLPPLTD